MKKILSLILLSSVLFSCTDDDIRTEQDLASGPKVVGFTPSFQTVSYFVDEGTVLRKFPLDLIGRGNGQYSSTDIDVQYTVNASESTAAEGLEYDFVGAQTASGTITIPAGASFGEFPLNVNTGNLDPLQKTILVLDLVSTSNGSVIGAQYKKLKIIFVGCLSNITTPGVTASYTAVIVRQDGITRTRTNETIRYIDVNTFKTKYTGPWAIGQLAASSDQGFEFIDICGDITVPSQNLGGVYPNLVQGLTTDGTDGLVADFSTGDNIEITYEVTFDTGNLTHVHTLTRN